MTLKFGSREPVKCGACSEAVAETKPFTPRNIHIVLLESFWDPNELKKPIIIKIHWLLIFAALESAGYSHAAGSGICGYTANSEFEVLCGFPVTKDTVKFERQVLNDVPCLPHLLADKGYRTVISHPNVPVFWNRVNAYRHLGFQTYWSKQDFVLDDMKPRVFVRCFALSSGYGENFRITGYQTTHSDYIVTYFGHWNYPLSESRPEKVSSRSEVEEVSTYANTMYYKSRELMVFLDQLRQP